MSRKKEKYEPGKYSRQILEGYLNGISDAQLREEIQAWLMGEHRAEERWAELEKLFNERVIECYFPSAKAIATRKKVNVILCFPEDIQFGTPHRRKRSLYNRVALYVAAVLLPIMIAIGGALYFKLPIKTVIQGTETTSIILDTIRCDVDQVEKVKLVCGSEITLHDEAILTYGDRGNNTLVGEAFFNVAKDDEPFILAVEDLTITVLGTEFIVRSGKETDLITVTLYSGLLLIENDKIKYELNPGEIFTIDVHTGEFDASTLDMDATLPDWVETETGMTGNAFTSVTFLDLLEAMESRYGITVDNRRPELNSRRYSFQFTEEETFEEVLKTLKLIYDDFAYRVEGNTVIVE